MDLSLYNPFNYSLKELQAAIIAVIYLVFSVLMLHFAFPVGFEQAVIAMIGPLFVLIGVFGATESSPMDLQKALEAVKGAIVTLLGFYVAVPDSANEQITIIIGSVVAVIAIMHARKGVVSQQ